MTLQTAVPKNPPINNGFLPIFSTNGSATTTNTAFKKPVINEAYIPEFLISSPIAPDNIYEANVKKFNIPVVI